MLGGTKYVHSSRGRAVRAAKCGCKPSQPGTICSTLCGLPHRAPRSLDTSRPPGPCWTPTRGKRDATDVDGCRAGRDGGRRSARSHPAALRVAAPTPPRQEWPAANPAAPRVGGAPQLSDPGPWSQCLPRRHARAGSCPGTPAHVQTWRAQRPLPRTLGLNRPNRAYSPHLADRRPPDANSGRLQPRALNRSPP